MYQDMVNYPSFPRGWADQVAAAGATPHISLELDDYKAGHLQPAYNNLSFTRGDHDAWLVNWASQAAAWGKPFILRPFWECSFRDYPWAAGNTDVGNSPGSFIDAWRHNAAIFRKGVPQARLAWNVEVDLPGMIPLEDVYPGGAWVDILSVDGYNTGPGAWTKGDRPFADIFGPTCARLAHLAASKPIIISEIGVNRLLPTAANWFAGIPPALEQDTRFRAVAALVFFNNTAWDGGTPLDFRYDQPSSKWPRHAF
jgi:beta-mannanase